MTVYNFENASQADAAAFAAGDTLVFATALPLDLVVGYDNGGVLGAATVTLTFQGKSLVFRSDALQSGDALDFRAGGVSRGSIALLGSGNDTISVYSVNDKAVWSFDGNDHVTIAGPGRVAVHGGAGDDLIEADNALQPGGNLAPTGYFFADGGTGDDRIFLNLATGPADAWGGGGSDSIVGGANNDHLYGNAANATAGAADGSDNIDGGGGNDYIQGNAGEDFLDGGTGNDRLYGGAGDDVVHGGDGHDYLQGNKGADTLFGDHGNDTLRGGAGDDYLLGGDQADVLSGDAGDDLLHGDAGDDLLWGGFGMDMLVGGAGADTFRFLTNEAGFDPNDTVGAVDRIEDFAKGVDRLELGFHVDAVIIDPMPTTFGALGGAMVYASQLMSSHAGDHEVVAMRQGGDTLLFYSDDGVGSIDSVIRLTAFDYTMSDLGLFA